MKRMRYLFIFALIGLSLSCQQGDEIETARKELMDLHDVSMERMPELSQLQKKLKSDTSAAAQVRLKRLKAAEDDMWDWMHTYNDPDDKLADEEKLKIYKKEYEEMKTVDQSIISSIKEAKKYLNED